MSSSWLHWEKLWLMRRQSFREFSVPSHPTYLYWGTGTLLDVRSNTFITSYDPVIWDYQNYLYYLYSETSEQRTLWGTHFCLSFVERLSLFWRPVHCSGRNSVPCRGVILSQRVPYRRLYNILCIAKPLYYWTPWDFQICPQYRGFFYLYIIHIYRYGCGWRQCPL